MDFQKTTLFIVPAGNTLPTTGGPHSLTASQFGVFRPDYSVASAGNIAAAKYILLAQGRPQTIPGLGAKMSDKIYNKNVIDLYKITGSATASTQITEVTGFSAACGETVTITLRLFSTYINTGFANGLTRSVTVKTPCCDCGDDPCTNVDIEDLVDQFVAGVNAEPMLSQFITATKDATDPNNIKLVLTGKALTKYGQRCDPTVFPYEYDKMYFRTYAYRGPETTQDYNVYDSCDLFATSTVTRKSVYPTGTPDEITQLEKNFYSYDTTHKTLFSNTNFNNAYTTEVSSSVTAYTTLYVRYYEESNNAFTDVSKQERMAIIAAPPTEAAAILTRLELFFGSGAFVDKTSTN